jgi:hypothetical protein
LNSARIAFQNECSSLGVVRNSWLPGSALIEVGTDHHLADPQPLAEMLEACKGRAE